MKIFLTRKQNNKLFKNYQLTWFPVLKTYLFIQENLRGSFHIELVFVWTKLGKFLSSLIFPFGVLVSGYKESKYQFKSMSESIISCTFKFGTDEYWIVDKLIPTEIKEAFHEKRFITGVYNSTTNVVDWLQ